MSLDFDLSAEFLLVSFGGLSPSEGTFSLRASALDPVGSPTGEALFSLEDSLWSDASFSAESDFRPSSPEPPSYSTTESDARMTMWAPRNAESCEATHRLALLYVIPELFSFILSFVPMVFFTITTFQLLQ